MTDQFEIMRANVLAKVAEHRAVQNAPNNGQRYTKLMGNFLAVRLEQQRHDVQDLAEALNVTTTVIELLLAGEIPNWMLSDETLIRLANATGGEANLLRIMLRREIDTTNLNRPAERS